MQDPFLIETDPLFDRSHALCFTGHRPEALPSRGVEASYGMLRLNMLLERAVVRALDDGFTSFLVGGALGFDTMAAETVLKLSSGNPDVRLYLSLPGYDQTEGWSERDLERYNAIIAAANGRVYYAADCCSPSSMRKRNRYLVDNASCCIAYLRRMHGGTLYTVNYALEQGILVDNLALRENEII
jgi:uncharacterized phage-like protein YoqJ